MMVSVLYVTDQFRPPLRPVLDKPLRLCVTDVFKAAGAGVAVAGMIHTGSVQAGDRIVAVPAGEAATVKGLPAASISHIHRCEMSTHMNWNGTQESAFPSDSGTAVATW